MKSIFFIKSKMNRTIYEARRGTEAQACDCKRDILWVRFLLEEI